MGWGIVYVEPELGRVILSDVLGGVQFEPHGLERIATTVDAMLADLDEYDARKAAEDQSTGP
jgi:hypothetical protein